MPIKKRMSSLFRRTLDGEKSPDQMAGDGFKSAGVTERNPVPWPARTDQTAIMDRMRSVSESDAVYNRIVVPVQYIASGHEGGPVWLHVPRGRESLRMSMRDFRALPADVFGEQFANTHVVLCLPEGMTEIPAGRLSGYDPYSIEKKRPVSVEGMANDFAEMATKELLGPDCTRGMGEFSLRMAPECKDNYACVAETVRTGSSPVVDGHARIMAALERHDREHARNDDFRPGAVGHGRDTSDLDAAAADISETHASGIDGPGYD